jgi:hypothetical protein
MTSQSQKWLSLPSGQSQQSFLSSKYSAVISRGGCGRGDSRVQVEGAGIVGGIWSLAARSFLKNVVSTFQTRGRRVCVSPSCRVRNPGGSAPGRSGALCPGRGTSAPVPGAESIDLLGCACPWLLHGQPHAVPGALAVGGTHSGTARAPGLRRSARCPPTSQLSSSAASRRALPASPRPAPWSAQGVALAWPAPAFRRRRPRFAARCRARRQRPCTTSERVTNPGQQAPARYGATTFSIFSHNLFHPHAKTVRGRAPAQGDAREGPAPPPRPEAANRTLWPAHQSERSGGSGATTSPGWPWEQERGIHHPHGVRARARGDGLGRAWGREVRVRVAIG